jgi:uncharacterized membrane protein YphA (DoxX/SURF4 family)
MNTSVSSLSPVAPPEVATRGSRWRVVIAIVRVLFGLMFAIFGLNGFLNFIPPPPEPPPAEAMNFAVAMMATGYLMPLVKGTELVCGLLLLCNRFVPLALVLLAPVIVNIVLFHVFLAPATSAMAFVVLAMELFLAWSYRAAFRPLLQPRFAA